ncbi:sigma D regulator [Salinimonas sediminis]|uniref:Sigma D regulator n=1 Tax=Salinimonas sediminis TaxID=2303538 RepID=A0A346NR66_9ALTE|nr:sigma D regulator [Salinimonas sediminis]AXR08023.1 sigma D regulator [Salinimonas sediminis]
MLDKLEQLQDQWGGHSTIVDSWLNARQQLLIHYCQLAGLNKTSVSLPEQQQVSEFCNMLMDYLSAGHFEVYELLVSDDDEGLGLKQRVYPLLSATTDSALKFNDDFATELSAVNSRRFDRELAALGEVLEDRFTLEDKLIQHMFEAHGPKHIQRAQQAKSD